ncbi:MAG: glycosyltransferase family A protein [Patescibacteria group bacterium]
MISIIIPIYNQANKLAECLDSILEQSYQDYEIIIIDDASKDGVEKIFEKYKNRLPIKIFKQKNNQGAPAARNRGLKESRGEYSFFCDADAILAPKALETMLEALKKHPEASYAYSSFLWGKKLFKIGPFSAERLKSGPCIHTMSLIKREDLPGTGWDESIKKLQDWDLYLTMLKEGHEGVWIDKILFTIQPGGTISSWVPSFAYKLLPFLPAVKKYKKAAAIIKNKHSLR